MEENSIKDRTDANSMIDSAQTPFSGDAGSPNANAVMDDNTTEETDNNSTHHTAAITEEQETPKGKKHKITKKKAIIIAIALVAVIAIAFIVFHKSKFERVERDCVQIAGTVRSGNGYFVIDTYPDDWENMDPSVRALLLPDHQQDALEGIRYANEALSFNGAVYNKMLETSALMGRQTQENSKYRVSWTYHPDDGLEVTYEVK